MGECVCERERDGERERERERESCDSAIRRAINSDPFWRSAGHGL